MVYSRFAFYYDAIYNEICDYKKDVEVYLQITSKHFTKKLESVIDLGCGSGKHLEILHKKGLEVAGIDLSKEMIELAKQRFKKEKQQISLKVDNMNNLAIDQPFDLATSFFGGFGYLTEEEEIVKLFTNIREKKVQLFVFEFWHTAQVKEDHQTWMKVKLEEEKELIRLSQSTFDSEKSILRIDFEFIISSDEKIVDRFTETHNIRTYTFESITELVSKAGCEIVGLYKDSLSSEQATTEDFRVIAVVKPLKNEKERGEKDE